MNQELSERFVHYTPEEHARHKSMWGNKHEASINKTVIYYENKVQILESLWPLLLENCFNEIIENVYDVYQLKENNVRNCDITFDSGIISIYNNGNGIPVSCVPDSKGIPVPVAELVSTRMFAGSNLNNESKNNTSAGTNGIGMTLVNVNSEWFKVYTADLKENKFFTQLSRNRMSDIQSPIIRTLKKKEEGTKVEWKPSYEEAHKFPPEPENLETLDKLFRTRVIQMAMSCPGLKLTYNGMKILNGKEPTKQFFDTYIKNGYYTTIGSINPWVVMIYLQEGDDIVLGSLINGIVVKAGTHIDGIKKLLYKELKPMCSKFISKYKEFKPAMINNNIQIFIVGKYPNPSFDSQSKNKITGAPGDLKEYSFSDKDIKAVWALLKPRIEAEYIITKSKSVVVKKTLSNIPKYNPARCLTKKNCTLFIAEGDSALASIMAALASKDVKMSRDDCGTFSIQGVPVNSRKASTVNRINSVQTVTENNILCKNERLKSLESILGLDKTTIYDSPDRLTYRNIVFCMDQDLDGIGQILGLLISHIHRFWPELFKFNMIKYMASPIIRAYPKDRKKTVQHFYSESQYNQWHPNVDVSEWNIKYYKGLATHTTAEAVDIFKKNVCITITSTIISEKRLDVYYGSDVSSRKIELTRPVVCSLITNNSITISEHLDEHTKGFQLGNLEQKLPNVVDGLKESQRKALYGISPTKTTKVSEASGYISASTGYHHGQDSLAKVLITMAQNHINSSFRIPLLKGIGQFGTRAENGSDHGSPRYVSIKLMDISRKIFRPEDMSVLDYVIDEGIVREPKVYSPIIPFVLTQYLQCIAAGFATTSYPRDWDAIVYNVKYLINRGGNDFKNSELKRMAFDRGGWKGVIEKKGRLGIHSVGVYKRLSNKRINVTEIPFGVSTSQYVTRLRERDNVVSVIDNSGTCDINLIIDFSITDHEEQVEILGLSKKLSKNLNFMHDGAVMTCEYYKDVFKPWYINRYNTYVLRFQREVVLTNLQILQLENKLRFIKNRDTFGIEKQNIDSITRILEENKFVKLNTAVINSPGILPTNNLESLATDCRLDNVNYKYLLSLTNYQQLGTAADAIAETIKKKKEYLEELRHPDNIKNTWLKELDELDICVQRAKNSEAGWDHDEPVFKM